MKTAHTNSQGRPADNGWKSAHGPWANAWYPAWESQSSDSDGHDTGNASGDRQTDAYQPEQAHHARE